jgi:hypothetical protein
MSDKVAQLYDSLIREFREKAKADGVFCIVINGEFGNAAALDGVASHAGFLPKILRGIADDLEADYARISREVKERLSKGEHPANVAKAMNGMRFYRDRPGEKHKEEKPS